jgi:hypothetical protein
MYNFDSSIFDNMVLPDGVVKDDIINNLLLELCEFELLYTSPTIMKAAIGYWSTKELPIWRKLYATTIFDYDPLTNLKRDDTVTNTETRNLSGSNNQTRNLTGGGTHHSETGGTTTNSGTDTQKEYNSGFNSNTPAQAKQTEQTLGTGNTVSGSVDSTDGSTDTGTVNNSITDTGTVTTTNVSHSSGSIGVITNQQFIEQERRVSEFNIIDYIITSFKERFCILVY